MGINNGHRGSILKCCGDHPNTDGSMPTQRIKEIWDELCRRDCTDRAWDHHRYKVLRDWMSQNGYLEWEDENYIIGREFNGIFEKGQAARWSASEPLLALLEDDNADVEDVEVGVKEPV